MTREVTDRLNWLLTDEGNLERPVAQDQLVSFEQVTTAEGILTFSGPARWAQPGTGVLLKFVNLAGKADNEIRAYAQEWGPLGLCRKHHLAWWHSPRECLELPLHPDEPVNEPVTAWRVTIRRARIILLRAANVHKAAGREAKHTPELDRDRWYVADNVEKWLRDGGVNVRLAWPNPIASPTISLGANRLYGALGVQLLMAAARSSGFAACSNCGDVYSPKKRPRLGENHYCGKPDCGGWGAEDKSKRKPRGPWKAAQDRRRAGLAKPRRKESESDAEFAARHLAWQQLTGVVEREH